LCEIDAEISDEAQAEIRAVRLETSVAAIIAVKSAYNGPYTASDAAKLLYPPVAVTAAETSDGDPLNCTLTKALISEGNIAPTAAAKSTGA
jgi:hypothetical protein